jgi:lipopolysaccharide transport system ATP-binding protein
MEDVGKDGKTVLFVSHNMAAVEKLCRQGIFLRQGQVVFTGSQSEAISRYLASTAEKPPSLASRLDRTGNGQIRITEIEIKDEAGNLLEVVASGQMIDVYFYFEARSANISRAITSLLVTTSLDIPVFLQHNRLTMDDFGLLPKQGAFVCRINCLPLPASVYQINYSVLLDGTYLDALNNAVDLTVVDGDFYGSGEVPPISHGVCLVDAQWRLEPWGSP